MAQRSILVTNDDGYFADGIQALAKALRPLGRVIVVAPDQDRSGVSHSLSISNPLRLRHLDEDVFALNGTPVDCIHIGLHAVFKDRKPDLIVSGINHGPNLGEDTTYSGTVAAAYEGFLHHVPSFAISTNRLDGSYLFENAQKVAHDFAEKMLASDPQLKHAVWNINVPNHKMKGFKFAALDKRSFKSSIVERVDPRQETYYWLGPYHPTFDEAENTDYAHFQSGYITATPLKVEMTHRRVLQEVTRAKEAEFSHLKD